MGSYNAPPDLVGQIQDVRGRLGDLERTSNMFYQEVLTDEAGSSIADANLATVGPAITLSTAPNRLVAVFAAADTKTSGGTGLAVLLDTTGLASGVTTAYTIINHSNAFFTPRETAPWSSNLGVTPGFGGFYLWMTTSATVTITMRYTAVAGACNFRSRKLWALAL